jgi:molybdopterin-guanine dinucleotide biosynthesis protein A
MEGRIAISILAGGRSARMGRDKSRVRLGGRSLLGHVRAAAEATGWPVRVIRRDAVPRCGPLGGIYTALQSSGSGAELFLACDMPFVSPGLLADLADRLGPKCTAVFAAADGRAGFPFLLRTAVLPVVEKQIQSQQFSLQSLAGVLGAVLFRVPKDRTPELWNINTPAEWRKARRLCETPP